MPQSITTLFEKTQWFDVELETVCCNIERVTQMLAREDVEVDVKELCRKEKKRLEDLRDEMTEDDRSNRPMVEIGFVRASVLSSLKAKRDFSERRDSEEKRERVFADIDRELVSYAIKNHKNFSLDGDAFDFETDNGRVSEAVMDAYERLELLPSAWPINGILPTLCWRYNSLSAEKKSKSSSFVGTKQDVLTATLA